MQLIRARLDGDVHHRPSGLPELGGESAGLDFEFLHRVDHRLDGLRRRAVEADDLVLVIDAVEQIAVLDGPLAVGDERVPLGRSLRGRSPRAQGGKLNVVAAVQAEGS